MAQENTDIARDETERLIASNKVEGTAVYSRSGDKLGSIHNFMVEKRSGQVEYAVLTSGGILGTASRYYPLPWNILEYDIDRGGYVVPMEQEQLEGAPHYEEEHAPRFDPEYDERVRSHYDRG